MVLYKLCAQRAHSAQNAPLQLHAGEACLHSRDVAEGAQFVATAHVMQCVGCHGFYKPANQIREAIAGDNVVSGGQTRAWRLGGVSKNAHPKAVGLA